MPVDFSTLLQLFLATVITASVGGVAVALVSWIKAHKSLIQSNVIFQEAERILQAGLATGLVKEGEIVLRDELDTLTRELEIVLQKKGIHLDIKALEDLILQQITLATGFSLPGLVDLLDTPTPAEPVPPVDNTPAVG